MNVRIMCRGGGGFRFAGTHQHAVLVVGYLGAVGVTEGCPSSSQSHTQRHHERHNQDRDAPDHRQVLLSILPALLTGLKRLELPCDRYFLIEATPLSLSPAAKERPALSYPTCCEGCSRLRHWLLPTPSQAPIFYGVGLQSLYTYWVLSFGSYTTPPPFPNVPGGLLRGHRGALGCVGKGGGSIPLGFAPITWGSSPASRDVRSFRERIPSVSPPEGIGASARWAFFSSLQGPTRMPGGPFWGRTS